MSRATVALALAVAFTAGADAQQADPASELHDRVPGPPSSCIEIDRVTGPLIFNANTVLYRQSGARIWRMTPEKACQALRWDAHLVVFNVGRRLCAGDRFNVLPAGSEMAAAHCRIGSFTPFDKAPL